MKLTKIILSVAAPLALVQAVAIPQGATGDLMGNPHYDRCVDEGINFAKEQGSLDNNAKGIIGVECGACFLKAVRACIGASGVDETNTKDGEECYTDSMNGCKKSWIPPIDPTTLPALPELPVGPPVVLGELPILPPRV